MSTGVIAAIRAHLTQIGTGPWAGAMLASATLLVTLAAVFAGAEFSGSDAQAARPLDDAFGLMLCLYLASMLGCLIVGTQLRSGELRAELLAMPRRGLAAGSGLLASALTMLAAGIPLFALDRIIRLWTAPGQPHGASELWRLGVGFLCGIIVMALVGMALTMILRHPMPAMAIVLFFPLLLEPVIERASEAAARRLPPGLVDVLLAGAEADPADWWPALAGLIIWGAGSAVAYILLIQRHDT